jgi:hypothetical protein
MIFLNTINFDENCLIPIYIYNVPSYNILVSLINLMLKVPSSTSKFF